MFLLRKTRFFVNILSTFCQHLSTFSVTKHKKKHKVFLTIYAFNIFYVFFVNIFKKMSKNVKKICSGILNHFFGFVSISVTTHFFGKTFPRFLKMDIFKIVHFFDLPYFFTEFFIEYIY